ncbi:hypothetical protein GF412_04945 [Candidatus Micrarchaeota archaeon]|nr:hypothetical protein [Candidatus Micrarchaeota archaeon]MBD3418300.1 hypothetical protein [Candidatus Micrarchaeota archaeon]
MKRKLAGAALAGMLSLSCAPRALPEPAIPDSPLAPELPKAEPEPPKDLRWEKFSKKYSVTEHEAYLLEEPFNLEQDKTALWPSEVFDALMGNSNLRKNHLQKSCNLICSVLERTEGLVGSKKALYTLERLFRCPKVGAQELDILLDMVEGGPHLEKEGLDILRNTVSIFRSDAYSPEFLKEMKRFFDGRGVLGYMPREEKLFVLNAFHGLSRRKICHSEIFAVMDETFELFSERVGQMVRAKLKEEVQRYGKDLPFTNSRMLYLGARKEDAAVVMLNSFTNPNFSEQMFEDLVSELRIVIGSDHSANSSSKLALKHLAGIYSLEFFDSRASSALRKHFKKYASRYGALEDFLESALIISKGRNFRNLSGVYLFVDMLEDLDQLFSAFKKTNLSTCLPDAANALAATGHYEDVLKLLKFSLRNASNDAPHAANAIYALALTKGVGRETVAEFGNSFRFLLKKARKDSGTAVYALETLVKTEKISPGIFEEFGELSKIVMRKRGWKARAEMFRSISTLMENSKNPQVSLDNFRFLLGQRRVRPKSMFSLLSVIAEQGIFADDRSFPEKFRHARHIAKESGAGYKNPEICLNFAYAVETIGEKRTILLHKEYGLEYFGRYPEELLINLFFSDYPHYKKNSPIAFVIYNKHDWNGAFYSDAKILLQLLKSHKIFLIEVNRDNEIPERIRHFLSPHKNSFGRFSLGGTINALLIGGHGSTRGISLGSSEGGRANITSSDMKMFSRLKRYFAKNPTVILVSCSTGRNEYSIGARISRVLGAELFAPKKDGNISSIKIGPKGEILDVDYTVSSNKFESGKIKPEEEE